ncbi:DNA replication endonuclease-helicase Dna2 [Microsporum ferrugineum]
MMHDPFVCSTSKAKLDAFRYAPKVTEMEMEELLERPTQEAEREDEDEKKQETRPMPCPETPVHKIPLADMISNTEDALNNAPEKVITPGDHVFWDHGGSFLRSTPNTARKKRNRSLSPASSPSYVTKDGSFTTTLTLEKVVPTTPLHDDAADLWTRYVSKADGLPAECNMPSSPRTPGLTGSARKACLRRANSCAIDWPKSATRGKRSMDWLGSHRRLRRPLTTEEGEPGPFGNSRINMLVDRIQESLLKSNTTNTTAATAPPSSSPLPDGPDIQQAKRLRFTTESPSKPAAVRRGQVDVLPPQNKDPESSDYGDDDQDQEFFELAAASTNEAFSTQSRNNTNTTLRPDTDTNYDTFSQLAKNMNDDSDDFDNDDYDGMDEIIASYNKNIPTPATTTTTTATITNQPPVTPQKGRVKNMVSEDELEGIMELDAFDSSTDDTGDNPSQPPQAIKRYLVIDLAENTYTNPKGRTQWEKVLVVREDKKKKTRAITLRDSWFDSAVSKDSYIHLIGTFNRNGQCLVDDSSNHAIIIDPDHLISATVVADSFTCPRRAVLQDRVKATSDANKPQVYGHILHEIFQEAMKANNWGLSWLKKLIDTILPKYIESLFEVNVSINDAANYLETKMPALREWAKLYVYPHPTAGSMMDDRNGAMSKVCINKLLEVEEHVWSPMYGLKGNIDATVQIVLEEEGEQKTLTVPLEVKTGKNNANHSHRAQTALYSLLLSDRYDINVTFGILYYLELSKTLRVRAIPNEIRQMIQQRNLLAGYLRQRFELPPMLKNSRLCSPCYAKSTCFLYHKLVDDGTEETSGVGKLFQETSGHLTAPHQGFFKKWDDLLTLEEKEMSKFRRELWTMVSAEREGVGRCFGNVIIENGSAFENSEGQKINRLQYTFVKPRSVSGFSFTESQINVGEPIVVSDEQGHFALANGYVVQISPRRITVAVDRRLHNARNKEAGFDAVSNQTFQGIMDISSGNRTAMNMDHRTENPMLYRLDKDEFSNGLAIVRNNLVSLMARDVFQSARLRELIVEGAAPVFKPGSPISRLPEAVGPNLNMDQKMAIGKVLSANDYALVLGMPGTGKTTTIAQIIRALVSQGKSVLLTSYTHTAVDNILLKIRDDKFRILRLGTPSKIHPEVQQFAELAATPKNTIEELEDVYENSKVVATTCLGVNHRIFNTRTFDYCIVDEASQITLPVCLGPIRMAKTFILVGDHYQLPPLVQSKQAIEGGLDHSLFKLLCDMHPLSVVNLEHQYRMCEEIMLLSNTLIYSNHLKCGTPAIATRSLSIPNINGLKRIHPTSFPPSTAKSRCLGSSHGRCWLRELVDPRAKTRFINTDSLRPEALDSAKGSRIINEVEATLCAQLVEAFIAVGIAAQDIGVVTLYRSQLSLLKQKLRHHGPNLEMHTADRFQGRDKEVIIMSCVRSNSDRNVGDLLRDWRRVNVAFTRARTKMLIVGSKATLSEGNELLGKFTKLMDEHQWRFDLPPNAVSQHVFAEHDLLFTQAMGDKSPMADKFANTLSPSPTKKQPQARLPLSPLKNKAGTLPKPTQGMKKPQKVGQPLNGERIIRKRPVLMDVLNDMLG